MTTLVNLNLRQGETLRWSPILRQPGTGTDPGPLLDMEGCTARAQFRQKYGSPVLVELTTENGGLVIGPVAGQLHIAITDEQTDALGATSSPLKPRTNAAWDLELVYPSGDVRRLMQGAVTINPNITRDVEPVEVVEP